MLPRAQDRSRVRLKISLRLLAAVFFFLAGVNHFVHPKFYEKIVPPTLPRPRALVAISGVCEMLGGVGLLVRPLRIAAGWGLLALLAAVFPANVYMAAAHRRVPHGDVPVWLLWARLPLQAVFMAWVWWVALDRPSRHRPSLERTRSRLAG